MQSIKNLVKPSAIWLNFRSVLTWRRSIVSSKLSSSAAWFNNTCATEIRRGSVTACWRSSSFKSSLPISFFRNYGDLPEHKAVKFPALSPTMSTGTIVSWEKEVGDELMDGDVLAQVETDKATMDMDSPQSGYMAKIIVPAGTKDIPLGTLVCIIVENEEDVAAFKNYDPPAMEVNDSKKTTTTTESTETDEPVIPPQPHSDTLSPNSTPQMSPSAYTPVSLPSQRSGRVLASPYARMLAVQQGIDLKNIKGTGTGGRIVSSDVEIERKTITDEGTASFKSIELSSMRKTIAKRLQESKQDVPHYYLTADVRMNELLDLQQQLNEIGQKEYKLTVNDFLIKACAAAMSKAPEVNSSWEGDHIRQYKQVDISIAVSTERGLITPIVFGADSKGLHAISSMSAELAQRARDGKLQPSEFQGGTFTISNLGMYGVKQFTAIINPPQACILAVGATEKRIIVDDTAVTGFFTKANMMTVTLSCDHRVVDGAVGAKWLAAFKTVVENPYIMLL